MQKNRAQACIVINKGIFFEVYLKASLKVCEQHDPKDNYT